jgi:hypothetical protein
MTRTTISSEPFALDSGEGPYVAVLTMEMSPEMPVLPSVDAADQLEFKI